MQKKRLSLSLASFTVILMALFLGGRNFHNSQFLGRLNDMFPKIDVAHASGSAALSGWAWSSNVGWLNFGSTTTPIPYGVSMDATTGNLTGYAWSSSLGWISFNGSDTTGCPSDPVATPQPCQANVNTTTGVVSGWAKLLTTGDWIELSGTNHSFNTNGTGGVSYISVSGSGFLVGNAWGGPFGWLSFNTSAGGGLPTPCTPGSSGCGVCVIGTCPGGGNNSSINLGLTVADVTAGGIPSSSLSAVPTTDSIKIAWNSTDSAGNPQTCLPQGELASASGFPSISGAASPVNGSYTYPTSTFGSGSSHTFTLKCSETSNSTVTQTQFVTVNFAVAGISISCGPAAPAVQINHAVAWNSSVTGGSSPYTYAWTFTGSPTVTGATTATPSTTYAVAGIYAATLQVNGITSQTCQSKINVSKNPVFKEF
jgi:hypothetical protein